MRGALIIRPNRSIWLWQLPLAAAIRYKARILAEVASKELGVPIVVINKGGGMGGVGATFVAKEKPDGYTILVTYPGSMTSNFALFPDLTYKRTDLCPFSGLSLSL